jgi:thioesterase domain-containing protein/acyl carrier protein
MVPHARLYNEYGPTEATVFSTVHEVERQEGAARIPIGRPIAGTECWVLDRRGELVPFGHPGELWVGGAGVSLGYHRRSEETARAFGPRPSGPRPGQRLYRSGDRVRLRADGLLEFLGREDGQVQVRGHRVEMGEIEEALRRAPGVKDAAVLLRRVGAGPPRLVGYAVLEGPAPRTAALAAISSHLEARLPSYMVPRTVMPLDALPRTRNGKLDRAALLDLPFEGPAGRDVDPPRDPVEERLALIWRDLLALAAGPQEDFFALGGDSLQAVVLMSHVEKEFQVTIPLSEFAHAPTIAALAVLITTTRRPARSEEQSLVVPIHQGAGLPLWLIHPVGGQVIYGERLRAHLDPRQTIFGLQARGLDGKSPPIDRIEDMAALYCARMLEHQPHGPYLIVGSSMGGLIALEIGIRLLEQGEEVRLIGLLDTWGPGYPRPTSFPIRVLENLRDIAAHPDWPSVKARLRRRIGRLWWRGTLQFPNLHSTPIVTMKGKGPLVDSYARVNLANHEATNRYQFRRYPGRVVLLRATRTFKWPGMRFDDPLNGLAPFAAGGVDSIPIDCTHQNMLEEPHIGQVGRALQRVIDEAGARG